MNDEIILNLNLYIKYVIKINECDMIWQNEIKMIAQYKFKLKL